MKILHDSTLLDSLSDSDLFIDTNVFIGALETSKDGSLLGLLDQLGMHGCAFITIQSVLFEFTRGGGSLQNFDKRLQFITNILKTTIYPIEKNLDDFEDLIVVLHNIRPKAGYTDFLLSACLYKFPNAFLITENHKDFPTEILDRKHVVTIDTGKEIRNYGIYKFSTKKYSRAAKSILKKSS